VIVNNPVAFAARDFLGFKIFEFHLLFGADKREVDLLKYDERITFLP
jgi:hypothetical protein